MRSVTQKKKGQLLYQTNQFAGLSYPTLFSACSLARRFRFFSCLAKSRLSARNSARRRFSSAVVAKNLKAVYLGSGCNEIE